MRLVRSPDLAAGVPYAYAAVTEPAARPVVTAGACPLDGTGATVAVGDVAGQAEQVSVQLSRDPETALRLHVVAEIGLNPDEKPSPRVAAVSSFLTFAVGAVIPLLPYLFGLSLLWVALVAGGAGLVLAGALSSRFTPRPWWYAGLRQLLFGAVAAGATYLIGLAIGVGAA